jgi:hypothetical protein
MEEWRLCGDLSQYNSGGTQLWWWTLWGTGSRPPKPAPKMRGWKKILGLGLEDTIKWFHSNSRSEQKQGHYAPGRGKTECSCLASALDLDGSILFVAKTVLISPGIPSKNNRQSLLYHSVSGKARNNDWRRIGFLSIRTWQAPVVHQRKSWCQNM